MTTYTPRHEDLTGASLSGSSGDANRTYSLANTDSIGAGFQIIIANTILQSGIDFSLTDDVLTFLNVVWDDQNITLDYWTQSTTTTTTGNYCSTLQIARIAGIGVDVKNESLGVGDGSENSYDLENGNVLADSYSITYGTTGSNSLATLEDVTDYVLEKDGGTILLTSTGVTKVNGKSIFASYTTSPKQSDTVLESYRAMIDAEVDKLTGNYWGEVKSSTEYFDGYASGYPHTDLPYGNQIESEPEFQLNRKGIQAITSIKALDTTGGTDETFNSSYIRFDEDGRVLVGRRTIPNGKRNIEIVYTHGYATVPVLAQELASYVGGMMALVNISGGSYKDVSTYSLGRKSFSIGQVYVNIESSIKQMKLRMDDLLGSVGFKYGIA